MSEAHVRERLALILALCPTVDEIIDQVEVAGYELIAAFDMDDTRFVSIDHPEFGEVVVTEPAEAPQAQPATALTTWSDIDDDDCGWMFAWSAGMQAA